jgi:two-component system sensor kinase FixL
MRRSREWGLALVYIAGYVLLDRISYVHPLAPYGITPWNPPPGLSVALLIGSGLRFAPALFVAAALADVLVRGMTVHPLAVASLALTLTAGYTLMAALMLRVLRFDPRLATLRDLAVFAGTVVVATSVIAIGYVSVLAALGLLAPKDFYDAALRFWVGDVIGIVVTTPFVLSVSGRPRESWDALRKPTLAARLQAFVLLALLVVLFAMPETLAVRYFYLLFLPLIWIGVTGGFRGTTLALLAIQIGLIVVGQARGYAAVTVVELQLFMLVLAFGALFLGMAISEHRAAQEALLARETELHDKQVELERALRHAAAAEMASALAHELNQPLSAVVSYLRACEIMLADPIANRARLEETMARVNEEARRAGEVVRGLREFFRTGTGRLAHVDLPALLAHAIEPLLGRFQRHAVRLRIDCEPALPQVHVDRMQVETVVQNLVGNAVDAMAAANSAERAIDVTARRANATAVRVCVADTGPGLDPEIASRLFLPFRSTKPHGMGLGLALSRTIVESHGGKLWHEPTPVGGMFCFTVPVVRDAAEGD